MAKTERGRAWRRAGALSQVLGFGKTGSLQDTTQGERNPLETDTEGIKGGIYRG